MLIDNVGRKNTLLYGSVGGAFCMFWVGSEFICRIVEIAISKAQFTVCQTVYVAVGKPQLRPAGSGPDSVGISAITAIYLFVM